MRRFLCLVALLAPLFPLAAAAQIAALPPAPPCAKDLLKPVRETRAVPPYPLLSQRMGEQGTTTLKVTIAADGTPSEASVEKSSGSLRLDDAAAAFVKENWRWQSFDKNCAPTIQTLVNVVWDLKDAPAGPNPYVLVDLDPADYPPDARAKQEQGIVSIAIQLSDTGAIINVRTAASSNFPDLDNKAMDIARTRWQWTPAQMAGKPVPTVILLAMRWRLPQVAPTSQLEQKLQDIPPKPKP